MAVSAVLAVGDDTADRFVEQLAPKVRALKIGQYDEPGVEMGPVITKEAKDRIIGYINQGESDGANVVVDGRNLSLQGYENGFFVGGTLLDHVTPDMSVYRDEIFGPVLGVMPVTSPDEALAIATDTDYGLHATVFTRDIDRAISMARRLPCGTVSVNGFSEGDIKTPFGGYKQSGSLARDNGTEALEQYLQTKTIWITTGG